MAVSVHGLAVAARRCARASAHARSAPGLCYLVALVVAALLTTTAHVLAPWPAGHRMAGGGLLGTSRRACPLPRSAQPQDANACSGSPWGPCSGAEVVLIAVTLNLLVAWPAQIAVPRCRRRRAGGTRASLRGQHPSCAPCRPPARPFALDPRLLGRRRGHLPHRGPRPGQDPDGHDRPRGARLVDRGRRHRGRWLHPRPGPVRRHGDRLRLRRPRGARRGGAHLREPAHPGDTDGRAAFAAGGVTAQDACPQIRGDLHGHR